MKHFLLVGAAEELTRFDWLLQKTSGIWDGGDGLEYQILERDRW